MLQLVVMIHANSPGSKAHGLCGVKRASTPGLASPMSHVAFKLHDRHGDLAESMSVVISTTPMLEI